MRFREDGDNFELRATTYKEAQERVEREREALRRAYHQDLANPNPLDSLTPDQLKEAWLRAAADDDQRAKQVLQSDATAAFMENHPEYIANPRNGQAITSYFEWRGLDGSDVSHYEQAWRDLCARGMVEVNAEAAQKYLAEEKRIRRQTTISAKRSAQIEHEQAEAQRRDPRNMTMDELRAAAMRGEGWE
jgi:hypothetical protein